MCWDPKIAGSTHRAESPSSPCSRWTTRSSHIDQQDSALLGADESWSIPKELFRKNSSVNVNNMFVYINPYVWVFWNWSAIVGLEKSTKGFFIYSRKKRLSATLNPFLAHCREEGLHWARTYYERMVCANNSLSRSKDALLPFQQLLPIRNRRRCRIALQLFIDKNWTRSTNYYCSNT